MGKKFEKIPKYKKTNNLFRANVSICEYCNDLLHVSLIFIHLKTCKTRLSIINNLNNQILNQTQQYIEIALFVFLFVPTLTPYVCKNNIHNINFTTNLYEVFRFIKNINICPNAIILSRYFPWIIVELLTNLSHQIICDNIPITELNENQYTLNSLELPHNVLHPITNDDGAYVNYY